MKKQYLAETALLIVTIIWGTSFVFNKTILNSGMGPFTLMMYRALFSIIILIPLVIKKIKNIKLETLRYGFLLGIFLFIAFAFQTVGANYTTGSKNAFLTTVNVIFVPIILFVNYKEKLDKYSIIAAVIALLGSFVLTINFNTSIITSSKEIIGDGLTLISALFWAIQIIRTGKYTKKVDLFTLVFLEFFVMFILSLVASIFTKESLVLSVPNTINILYLSIFCTVLAFGIQTYAMKFSTPTRTSLIFTFEGLFGAIFSIMFLNENLTINTLLGGILIFVSLIISETKFNFSFKNNRIK